MNRVYYLFGLLSLLMFISACSSFPTTAVEVSTTHTSVEIMPETATATPETPPPAPSSTPTPVPTAAPTPSPAPTYIAVPTHADVPILAAFSSPSLRVLEQPVAAVREGITIAVEQMVVYPERIELVYTVRDIPQSALFDPIKDDVSLSCGGPASYANLQLPDGTVIYPENYLLDGKAFDMFEAYSWGYLIHLYQASIPQDVSEITFVLECIGVVKLDLGLEYWEIPFRIVPVR